MAQNDTPDRAAEIETLFATAKRHHQAGQLAQAEPLYRQVLAVRPAHLGSLNYLAIIAQQQGKPEAAVELLTGALAINDQVSDLHNNIAEAHAALGRTDAAIRHYRRAIEIEPEFLEARTNLGTALRKSGAIDDAVTQFREAIRIEPGFAPSHNGLAIALHQLGRTSEAIASYRKVLTLDPNHAEACNNLGIALSEHGELAEGAALFQRAVTLRPDFAEAHTHLGNALREQGRLDEAVNHCRRAVALRPEFPEGLHNLAAALFAQGQTAQALSVVRRALGVRPMPQSKLLFVSCVKDVSVEREADSRALLLRALTEPWGRPADLAAACARLIRHTPAIQGAIELAGRVQAGGSAVFGRVDIEIMANDPLLLRLLEITPVSDDGLERLMTGLRRHLLHVAAAASPSDPVDDVSLGLYTALGRQCFVNQYVFAAGEGERAAADTLCDRLAAALSSNAPMSMLWIVAAACYRPLHMLPEASRLLARSWPDALAHVIRQQIAEPREEQRLAAAMPQLTDIADHVSLDVQRQYEESPYPTWVINPPITPQRSIPGFLRSQFPFAAIRVTEPPAELSILIAGCGTGRQPIEVAQQYPNARVLAVDLSLASLAYAKRKTNELGLRNIEYAHADILALGSIGRTFDMIQSSGVLHHLADPMQGWRTLVALLKPHGFMAIGLYSQLARSAVTAARAFIESGGYRDTPDDISRCRQDLISGAGGPALRGITASPDFFSTAACRDLLFHVQEHQMTLPQIAAFVTEQRLQFLGFELEPRALDRYRRRFPEDRAAANLANWHTFETENPDTFAGMYQFWLQRSW